MYYLSSNAARHLRDRCHVLVLALRDGFEKQSHGVMTRATAAAIESVFSGSETLTFVTQQSCLVDIQTRMDGWVHIGKIKGFTKQLEIEGEIGQCLGEISDCLTKFQVSYPCLPFHAQFDSEHRFQVDFALTSAHLARGICRRCQT